MPAITSAQSNDCTDCLIHSITPLNHVKHPITDAINALATLAGNTDIPQGLYWACGLLMPGGPFNEAVASVSSRVNARSRC